jgi:hypothetical protein
MSAGRSTKGLGFQDTALIAALEAAKGGNDDALFTLLRRHSNLPGVRANVGLAEAFGEEMATRGKPYDALLDRMLRLDADRAPGGTELEFLPMCAVYGHAARGARDDKARKRAFARLREAADDLRFRVRDAVAPGLVKIGSLAPEETLRELASWNDGYMYAASTLQALATPLFLDLLADGEAVADILDGAFALAKGAPRSAERYPGYKSLLDALAVTPGLVAGRFGAAVFDRMVGWSTVKEPMLREAIEKTLRSTKLAGRFAEEVARVHAALDASAPKRRDPTTYVGKTRNRSKKR